LIGLLTDFPGWAGVIV